VRRLIIRPGAIGDFILSLPAMQWLTSGYTEVWAASGNLTLARFAAHTRAIAATGLDLLGLPEVAPPAHLLEALGGFDSIISWYGSNRPEFRSAVESLRLPFRFLPAAPPPGAREHAADFFLRRAGGEGEAVPRLDCQQGSGDFIAIHPFSGSAKKNWPLERYVELSRRLALPVRWFTGPDGPAIEGVRPEPPIGDLYALACRLAGARLYIGNDSGITHLAAAAGAPVLALFGPTDPAVWSPRGPQVHFISPLRPGDPITQIGLDQVLSAARRLLG